MRLIPVNQWVYDLAKVTYHESEDSPALVTAFFTYSNDDHLVLDIEDRWPGPHIHYYRWERVAENVGQPRRIGEMYGMPLTEGAQSHAAHVLERLKISA